LSWGHQFARGRVAEKIRAAEVGARPDLCLRDSDEFVVGYGLDYNDEYRNLPYEAALERRIFKCSAHDVATHTAVFT
jgi:hypothetical protein